MKKLVKRKRAFRVNNPLAFGILCAMILIFIAGVTYALAAGVVSPIVRSYQLAHATPTPTPTVAPATPTPSPTVAPALTPAVGEGAAPDGTVDPAATPTPAGGTLSGRVIGIDPARGYSSKVKGISTGIYANRLNYSVAILVRDKLVEKGASVIMGLDDVKQDKDSTDRANVMNVNDVELACRIECNYVNTADTRGAIVWIPETHAQLDACRSLGNAVLKAYIDATGLSIAQYNGASIRQRGDDAFLKNVTAPVCTLITGYISNDVEDRTLNNETFQNNMADGIVKGIEAYLNQ